MIQKILLSLISLSIIASAIFILCQRPEDADSSKVSDDCVLFADKKKIVNVTQSVDTIYTAFEFKNEGKSPVHIDTIMKSCGCTMVNYPHTIVKGGNKGIIKVAINIKDVKGFFSKSLAVYFNNHSPIILKIEGIKKTK